MKTVILFISLILLTTLLNAQTYINKEWVENYGAPDSIDWTSTHNDVWGNINIIGNTLVTGQRANLLLSSFDNSGDVNWQINWNGPKNGSDYGVDLIGDANMGYLYAVGASNYSNDTSFDIILHKYDASGNLIWETSYDGAGMNDYPIKIVMDDVDGLYITGTSEANATGFDFITLKYDTSGTLIWSARYDFTQHIDIGADIIADPAGTLITVTGDSEDSAGIWDYTTITYDMYGEQIDINREPAGSDIKKPRDIVKDQFGNYYITGVYNNGDDDDIKLIKLDSTLNVVWVAIYNNGGGGTDEQSNSLAMDNNGNLYIAGWRQNPSFNEREFLVLKFDTSGNLVWQQTLWPDEFKPLAEATKLNIAGNSLNVIGFCSNVSNSDIVTARFSALNGDLELLKIWENTPKSIDYPADIFQDGQDIYLTGRAIDNFGTHWVVVKYSIHETDTAVLRDTIGKVICSRNQLIIRFDAKVIKPETVNNTHYKSTEFGFINEFLKDSAATVLQTKLNPFAYETNFRLLKIFKEMSTTDTLCQSRLGEDVRIPEFWATFILEIPYGNSLREIADTLNTLFPMVAYTHPNYICYLTSPPSDTMYDKQISLHPGNPLNAAHINMEKAWEITEAKPFVKVGVFDNGLFWKHRDFGYTGSKTSSVVKDGWDLKNDAHIKNQEGLGDHGTPVAGIITAVKNNDMGIAGIAGRNNNDTSTGVSLYDMRIMGGAPPGFFRNTLDKVAEAIKQTAIDGDVKYHQYGLHLSNNSWGFDLRTHPDMVTDSNITLLTEAIHFANHNKVTFVASSGNIITFTNYTYPSIVDSNWVICVSGTGRNGHFKDVYNGNEAQWEPSVNKFVDIAAPCDSSLIRTISEFNSYVSFNGTSSAAPHVTGVAALLLSYLNQSGQSPNNLAPEDVERILELSATDTDSVGYDILTGYGRLNAGAALELVKKPSRKLIHSSTGANSHIIAKTLAHSNKRIQIAERFQNQKSTWFKPGVYNADVYKIDATVQHNIGSVNSVMYSWPRHSSSELLPLFYGGNKLIPRERIILNSVNKTSASLTGYIYKVSDTLNNYLGWWPFDTTQGNFGFAYTLLVRDSTIASTEKADKNKSGFEVFPNPVSDKQTIIIHSGRRDHLNIKLYDISGRVVKNVYEGAKWPGDLTLNVSLDNIPAGFYFYSIVVGQDKRNFKVIKQ